METRDQATQDFINSVSSDFNKRSIGQKIRRVEEKKKPSDDLELPIKPKTIAATGMALATKKIGPMAIRAISDEFKKEAAFDKEAALVEDTLTPNPFDVYNAMTSRYKREWFEWDPSTIRLEIASNPELEKYAHEDAYQTIFALQTIAKTNYPFESWHIFENIGHALNNNVVIIDDITPLDIHEAGLTYLIMRDIRPDVELSEEVCTYIAACSMESGLVLLPPKIFDPRSQEALDEMNKDPSLKVQVLDVLQSNSKEIDEVVQVQVERIRAIYEYLERNKQVS
jgi:hypothetical protein